MKKKTQLLIQGYGFIAVALFFLALLAMNFSEDEFYVSVAIVVGIVYLLYKSYSAFSQSKAVAEDEPAYVDPLANTTTDEKLQYYRKILYVGVPAFALLSAWIIYELNNLESGEVHSVSIWGPVALIYEYSGYWPAVLFLPVLGVLSVGVLIRKSIQLKKQEADTL